MLHRAVFGSLERFIAILIENFAGDLPLWINPQQIRVLPVSEKFLEYSRQVNERFRDAGFISEVDERNDKIGFKIREGEREKVPYLVILGEKEQISGNITLRKRKVGDLGSFSLDDALEKIKLEVSSKGVEAVEVTS
jgi:threonyl-tRNA synthetase